METVVSLVLKRIKFKIRLFKHTATPPNKVLKGLQKGVNQAGKTAVSTGKSAADLGNQLGKSASQSAQTAVSNLQRRFGEDYETILTQNPIVLDTMSRADLLAENKLLLEINPNLEHGRRRHRIFATRHCLSVWSATSLWAGAYSAVERNQSFYGFGGW